MFLHSIQVLLQHSQQEVWLHRLGETVRNHRGRRDPFQAVSSILHRVPGLLTVTPQIVVDGSQFDAQTFVLHASRNLGGKVVSKTSTVCEGEVWNAHPRIIFPLLSAPYLPLQLSDHSSEFVTSFETML